MTDWAWYEGLPNWIPLSQIPGVAAIEVSAKRPIAVWIICIFYFCCFPFALLGIAMLVMMSSGMYPVHLPKEQLAAIHQTPLDYVLTGVGTIINLAWAIQLFRLKRQALYLYLTSIALAVLTMIYHLIFKHQLASAHSSLTLIFLIVAWTLNLLLLWYIWHLARKGVLQ